MSPGCLGSVISFDATDEYCKACSYKNYCRDKVGRRLIELRESLDVSDFIREFNIDQARDEEDVIDGGGEVVTARHSKPASKRITVKAVTKEQFYQVNQDWIPKKAKKLMLQMFKKGIDGRVIHNQLKIGLNPFKNETPVTMRVACELLINGGFEKSELRMALVNNSIRQMSSGTAFALVSILTSTLLATKVAYEEEGKFMMVKNYE